MLNFLFYFSQVNIVANNSKDFRSWFGFCEARLRILIVSLESPENGVQAYPFARFFFRKVPLLPHEQGNGTSSTAIVEKLEDVTSASPTLECLEGSKVVPQEEQYVSSFFVALRFAPNIECIDLTGSAQEMLFKVNSWEDRREGMDMTIEHLMQNQLPAFVFEKTCTSSCFELSGDEGNKNNATRREDNDDADNMMDGTTPSETTRCRAELGKRRNTTNS
jgi:poly(A) polymerase Pap1